MLFRSHGQPVACLAWSSAPRHIASRDRFIGWTAEMRRRHLCLMACNTRFLILPWVRVPLLASHILGRMARNHQAGRRPAFKKAVVQLVEGDHIELYEAG